FPFLDRDFSSVAELLLVPNCPPGLFTKKFAEDTGLPDPNLVPPGPFRAPYPLATPPPTIADPDDPTEIPDAPDLQEPHPYPYLPHKFYYGAQDDGTGTGNLIPVRWYQMLE